MAASPPTAEGATSPSSTKKSKLEFSEGDVGGTQTNSNNDDDNGSAATGKNSSSSSSTGNGQQPGHNADTGGRPVKLNTPAAEHLRYGHVDFEEIEESEEDKRRHYLLRKPKVKQWFYRGKLFRSAEGRASARIEL